MIFDKVENWSRYPFGPAWESVFTWLAAAQATPPTEVLALDGDRIVVRPGHYTTIPREKAVLEVHRRYADVQILLQGREWAECHDPAALVVETPYQPDRDVEFLVKPDPAPCRFQLLPGTFALFLPGEAHMTQMRVADPGDEVVKLVVKVDGALLGKC